jgi:hypothetical protein
LFFAVGIFNSKDKETDRVHRAQETYDNLNKIFNEEQKKITNSFLDAQNIPHATILYDRIRKYQTYNSRLDMITDTVLDKRRALANLKSILIDVAKYPTKSIAGDIILNPNQDLLGKKKVYASIKQYIGSDESISTAQGQLQITQKDERSTFGDLDQTKYPDSLYAACIQERSLPIYKDTSLLDKASGYLCGFNTFTNVKAGQAPPNMTYDAGSSAGSSAADDEFANDTETIDNGTNQTIEEAYYPTAYTYTWMPFKSKDLRINCDAFYNSSEADYQIDTFSN